MPRKLDDRRPILEPPPVHEVSDDDIRHELTDWSLVPQDENGDLVAPESSTLISSSESRTIRAAASGGPPT